MAECSRYSRWLTHISFLTSILVSWFGCPYPSLHRIPRREISTRTPPGSLVMSKMILEFVIFPVEAKGIRDCSNWAPCLHSYFFHRLLIFIVSCSILSFKSSESGTPGIEVNMGHRCRGARNLDHWDQCLISFIWLWECSRDHSRKKVGFQWYMQRTVTSKFV